MVGRVHALNSSLYFSSREISYTSVGTKWLMAYIVYSLYYCPEKISREFSHAVATNG